MAHQLINKDCNIFRGFFSAYIFTNYRNVNGETCMVFQQSFLCCVVCCYSECISHTRQAEKSA